MKKHVLTVIIFLLVTNIYAQLPYTESFESGLGIWQQLSEPYDQLDWTRWSGATPTAGTGPSAASDGNYYMYVEASGDTNHNKSAILQATFDFSDDTLPVFSFDYHLHGLGVGDLRMVVLQGSDSVEVWNAFDDHGDQWNSEMVPLKDFAHKSNVKIRFVGEIQYSDSSDIAIDNIDIRDFKITDTSHQDVTCGGYADGSITITVDGGFPPYYYSIDGGYNYVEDNSTSHTFTNLSGQDYTIFVKDKSGAKLFGGVITVFEPQTPSISTTVNNVSPCVYSHNGEITINASGDNSPFLYSIDGINYNTLNNFTNLDTGLYPIYVKDSQGCIAQDNPVHIECPDMIKILDITSEDVSTCNGDCNGEIHISAGGGNTPLTYALDTSDTPDFENSSDFTGLCAGNYAVIVKDNAGCLDTSSNVTISEPSGVQINSTTYTDVTGCYGDSTGTITVSASGGTGTIEYSIDNGYNFQTNGSFDSLIAGTYHIVVRDQNNCTTIGDTITISQPELLVLDSTTFQNPQGCNNETNGQITIYAHGGTSPISYSIDNGNNFNSSNNFTNLDVGTYYPYIKDVNGCRDSAESVTLTRPPTLQIDTVVYYNVTTCNGDSTAKIQIYASSGVSPYEYSIDGGVNFQTSYIFDSLPAGDYNIVVRDANTCTKNWPNTITITQPTAITIDSVSSGNVSCNGANDGFIYVNASGGTGDLHYSIDNGISFPYDINTETYIGPGTYTIAVGDENNCRVYGDTIIITQPDTLLIDSVKTTDIESCYGANEGSITLYVSGGTQPYQFSIDNGQSFQDSNHFVNLPAGTNYWPYVIDAHNCSRLGNKTSISQPSQITIYSQDHTDVDSCHGTATGTITINAEGGTGTLLYSIDNGNTFHDNNGIFTNLYAGTYHTKIKDQNNCVIDGWDEVINQPDTLIIDSVVTIDVKCFGYGDGAIYITASGGQPQLKYSIDSGLTFHVENQFTSVTPGHYNIIVKDNYNCRVYSSTDVNEPTQLVIDTVYHTDVNTCYGDNSGSIEVIASGGTNPLHYSYCPVNETPTNYQDTNVFENIPAGSYYVTVMDNNTCMQTSPTITITQPPMVQITNIQKQDISCYGMNDGSITITATGGNGVFQYSIDNGTNWLDTNVFENLPAGDYLVLVRDTNDCNCLYAHPVTILEPNLLQINEISPYDPTCYGEIDGKITVNTTGGTYPYTYILNDSITQSQSTFFNLDSGYYWVTVIDSHNCVAQSDTVYLRKPLNFANFTVSDTIGCSPLSATFTPDSIYGSYHWYFSDSSESLNEIPTHIFNNFSSDTRTFDITCYSYHSSCIDTAYGQINVYPQPNLNFQLDTNVHYYPNTTVEITNLTDQYSNYFWDFGDGDTFSGIQPIDHTYDTCGTFQISLSAENEYHCVDTSLQSVFITATKPQAGFIEDKSSGCKPLSVSFTNLSTNSNRYEWSIDNNIFSTDTNPTYTFSKDGNFLVYLYAYGNCGLKDSSARFVLVYPTPEVDFEVSPDTQSVNRPVQFTNLSSGASYYIWDFGDSTFSSNTDETHYYKKSGYYNVTLKAYSPNQCYASLVKENAVYILDSMFIEFPTAFSPDGDGINDYFKPVSYMVKECTVEIYNSTGHLIFKTKNFDTEFWDGTINGRPQPIGVYIWRATGKFITGEPFVTGGSVTLLR